MSNDNQDKSKKPSMKEIEDNIIAMGRKKDSYKPHCKYCHDTGIKVREHRDTYDDVICNATSCYVKNQLPQAMVPIVKLIFTLTNDINMDLIAHFHGRVDKTSANMHPWRATVFYAYSALGIRDIERDQFECNAYSPHYVR